MRKKNSAASASLTCSGITGVGWSKRLGSSACSASRARLGRVGPASRSAMHESPFGGRRDRRGAHGSGARRTRDDRASLPAGRPRTCDQDLCRVRACRPRSRKGSAATLDQPCPRRAKGLRERQGRLHRRGAPAHAQVRRRSAGGRREVDASPWYSRSAHRAPQVPLPSRHLAPRWATGPFGQSTARTSAEASERRFSILSSLVDLRGLEPLTSTLPVWRSPS